MAAQFWSAAKVAQLIGVTPQTVRNWHRRGELPGAAPIVGRDSQLVIPKETVSILVNRKIQQLEADLERLRSAEVA